ncbi:MAG: hypothetical protein P8090_09765 [Gammaproteobacteria bacterium]
MLLNLANHLAATHDVSFVTPPESAENAGGLLEILLPQIERLSLQQARHRRTFDVLLCHLPYGFEDWIQDPIFGRRVAVSMEIVERTRVALGPQHQPVFDAFLCLHSEQIRHFDDEFRRSRCFQLPLIDDVSFEPAFVRTRAVGCVGAPYKHSFGAMVDLLRRVSGVRQLRVYGHKPLWSIARHSPWRVRFRGLRPWLAGRLQYCGTSPDIRKIFESFDCLLHTPRVGNGTSIVVNNALACGKLVVLSDLPAYRRAYSGRAGVHFLPDVVDDLPGLFGRYDFDHYQGIIDDYRKRYDRAGALEAWQEAVLGE